MAQSRGTRMNYMPWILASSVWLVFGTAGVSSAADSPPGTNDINALLKRIEELEQKVKRLEESKNAGTNAVTEQHLQELDQKVTTLEKNRSAVIGSDETKRKETPLILIGGDGFTLATANGDFKLQLKGFLQ